jgi:hypothetical protein
MAFSFLFNCLNTYPLNKINKTIEVQIIRQIAQENEYLFYNTTFKKLSNKNLKKSNAHNTQGTSKNNIENNKRWTIFAYIGKETRHTTKLFKNSNVKPAFRTANTLKKHLLRKQGAKEKFSNSGVYKLKCGECLLQYTGQTGHTFMIRYKEHIRDIRINKYASGFVQHYLDTTHTYGKID